MRAKQREATTVLLALRERADGQHVDPADEVAATAGRWVMDHWPRTLPDLTT